MIKKIPCIEVEQPLGTFYLTAISSKLLTEITYSRVTSIDGMELIGNQRGLDDKRVLEISKYLQTVNAAIPNSVILAANYDNDDNLETEPDKAWFLTEENGQLFINIPNISLRLAGIVDGQHRINGFLDSNVDMDIPCSIYFDLPPSLQALVFSTINFNQKKVDKSLAYQLFGYQLDDSTSDYWSPDIVAVKLSREFNIETDSPFYKRIELIKSPKLNKKELGSEVVSSTSSSAWTISSACFISGIVLLLSGNAKNDRYAIGKKNILGHSTRSDLKENRGFPLRNYYLNGNDLAIKMVVERYFKSLQKTLWKNKDDENIVFRAIGITAQFQFLKELLIKNIVELGPSLDFDDILKDFSDITFDSEYFSPRSATKKRLLDVFRLKAGQLEASNIEEEIRIAAGMTL
jgi:DNA phosphorothioation-associated DGQHR protein 1